MILLVTELAVLEDPAVVDEDDEAAELRLFLRRLPPTGTLWSVPPCVQ